MLHRYSGSSVAQGCPAVHRGTKRPMIVRKAFKYRIYPNKKQQAALAVQFGHARYIYNWGLAQSQDRYPGYNRLAKQLPILKASEDTSWLKEAHSQVLQQSLKNLDRGYQNFFDKRAGLSPIQKQASQAKHPLPTAQTELDFTRRAADLPAEGRVCTCDPAPTTGRRDEECDRIENQERENLRQHSGGSGDVGTGSRWRSGWHRSGTARFPDPVQRRKNQTAAILPQSTAETRAALPANYPGRSREATTGKRHACAWRAWMSGLPISAATFITSSAASWLKITASSGWKT